MRIGIVLLDFTGSNEIINRVLKLFNLAVADTSFYQCLELFTKFQIFKGVCELFDCFDSWRILHSSVD